MFTWFTGKIFHLLWYIGENPVYSWDQWNYWVVNEIGSTLIFWNSLINAT